MLAALARAATSNQVASSDRGSSTLSDSVRDTVSAICRNEGKLEFGSYNMENNWASEASPTLGCSIEISGDIHMSVGMSVVYQNP